MEQLWILFELLGGKISVDWFFKKKEIYLSNSNLSQHKVHYIYIWLN